MAIHLSQSTLARFIGSRFFARGRPMTWFNGSLRDLLVRFFSSAKDSLGSDPLAFAHLFAMI